MVTHLMYVVCFPFLVHFTNVRFLVATRNQPTLPAGSLLDLFFISCIASKMLVVILSINMMYELL